MKAAESCIKTHILPIDPKRPTESAAGRDALAEAARRLRAGELVAFPTETVYGLGADGLNGEACAKIFAAKGRPADNPLILHIQAMKEMQPLVDFSRMGPPREAVEAMLASLWPGPLTVIFQKRLVVPDVVTGGGPTVALRMPSHPVARALIRYARCPIAAPSANRSGRPSPTQAADVKEDMDGRVSLILDGGACGIGIESTVLDVTGPPVILRPGYYTPADFAPWLGRVAMDPALVGAHQVPRSPGQKYRHYAPKAPLTVYVGAPDVCGAQVEQRLEEAVRQAKAEGKRVGVLLFEGMASEDADFVEFWGKPGDLDSMARGMYTKLRAMDRAGVDVIFGAGIAETSEYAISIMNRLRKSAGGHVQNLEGENHGKIDSTRSSAD
uniref:L-threonylcarbamoyladenylate synthase n=1 Tax=Ndongobacter massiliensis TaxID=1871025 RepID=UPI0009F80F40|nr:L-threonylcarbamoyladenylate synthase [Ndongobacter massiliensis]